LIKRLITIYNKIIDFDFITDHVLTKQSQIYFIQPESDLSFFFAHQIILIFKFFLFFIYSFNEIFILPKMTEMDVFSRDIPHLYGLLLVLLENNSKPYFDSN